RQPSVLHVVVVDLPGRRGACRGRAQEQGPADAEQDSCRSNTPHSSPPVRAVLLPKRPLHLSVRVFGERSIGASKRVSAANRARFQSPARAADIPGIDRTHPFLDPGTLLRVLPTTAVVGVAWALAWATNGSIDAGDWLPYAVIVCVVLAAALVAGIAVVPARLPLIASALLVGFGLWT